MKSDSHKKVARLTTAPSGCFCQFVVDDSCEPLIHCGECAIVDGTDKRPIVGELFVIEQNSPWPPGKTRRIVEICLLTGTTLLDGSPAWFVGSPARDQYIPGLGATRMLEGAFSAEGLAGQLLGRVLGVLATDPCQPSRPRQQRRR